MHRLVIEGAHLHKKAYICAPCRLRLASGRSRPSLALLQTSYTTPRRFLSSSIPLRTPDENATTFNEAEQAQEEEVKLPGGGRPQNDLDTLHSSASEDPNSSEQQGSSSSEASAKEPLTKNTPKVKATDKESMRAFKDLLNDHQAVKSEIHELKAGRTGGNPGELAHMDLMARVKKLEDTVEQALQSKFPQGTTYHTTLSGYRTNIRNMTKALSRLRSTTVARTSRARRTANLDSTKSIDGADQYPLTVAMKREFTRHTLDKLEPQYKHLIQEKILTAEKRFVEAGIDNAEALQEHMELLKVELAGIIVDKKTAARAANIAHDRLLKLSTVQHEVQLGQQQEDNDHVGVSIEQAMRAPSLSTTSTALQGKDMKEVREGVLESAKLELQPFHVDQPPVNRLSYGLDRVLFNQGVYRLQDLRSNVYNFDPYLENLIPVKDFNFDLLPGFITSSKDAKLQQVARENKKKYTGSSSSMTSVLTHFHLLLSRNRPINTQMISGSFTLTSFSSDFTPIPKAPASIFLRYKDGVYAIDSDKEHDSSNVLSLLGNSLEKLLTLDKDEYLKYRRDSKEKPSEEALNAPETYHYTGLGDVLMRSQLDAYDPRLPGTGMFDIKTRAIWPIRMNVNSFQEGIDYEIKNLIGRHESYEREYLDMLRATMIKYMLQARIGRMDGIFVAYHNTQRIFGCQYLPLEEIDLALHGQADRSVGDQEFKLSVGLMNDAMNQATERFPNTSIRMTFRTVGGHSRTRMFVFAEPMTESQADDIQRTNAETVAAITKELLAGRHLEVDKSGRVKIFSKGVEDEENPAAVPLANDTSVIDQETAATTDSASKQQHGQYDTTETEAFPGPNSKDSGNFVPPIDDDGSAASAETTAQPEAIDSQEGEIDLTSGLEAGDAAYQSELLAATSPKKGKLSRDADSEFFDELKTDHEAFAALASSKRQLLALELSTQNFVNGKPVLRPGFQDDSTEDEERIARLSHVSERFSSSRDDEWDVGYKWREVEDSEKAWALYMTAHKARNDTLSPDRDLGSFLKAIRDLGVEWSAKGKRWRAERDERLKDQPKVVLGDQRPRTGAGGRITEDREG